jgi:hypothetical protein
MVSQTVKDLVAGSGLTFENSGEHELKGVPDCWHLYRVVVDRARESRDVSCFIGVYLHTRPGRR